MSVNYNKLWKLLIDKDMKKQDLRKKAGLSKGTITKLGKNENVSTQTLGKICSALNCDIGDIAEFTKEEVEE
ncbi:MAG TPA: XRE family transcriptional regulator [Bacteroides graminisolvens]|uniref:XRE family transcriptional regulator n=1 Tax=Bacteroides graminisolvens TaxID=477666 RepID=A0A3D2SG63_9BACE|nr:XRE family transcriptional regulator [Bacteroides graminisolvens]